MTEMVTSSSMSGEGKRSDGLLGESDNERRSLASGAAGPVRHRALPRLYRISTGAAFSTAAGALSAGMMGGRNAHRPRYESTSPTGSTVGHGRSSGDDARWSDIAYSDVVRVWPTQDSTIGLAQDQRHACS